MLRKLSSLVVLFSLVCVPVFADTPVTKAVVNVTTSGTAVVLGTSSERYQELTVCARTNNTGVVYVGDSAVSYSSKRGTPLWGGSNRADCRTYVIDAGSNSGRLSNHYVDAEVNGEGVTIEYFKRD